VKLTADWLNDAGLARVMSLLTDAGYLSTDALPHTVMKLAETRGIKALPTGIDHGTITLVINKEPFEITTFRKDVETDGRRAVVAFSNNIMDDAKRRDLTMNAIYADQTGQIVDPLGGLDDALTRRIRFIDDPHDRISEDYLRILRFFRFYAYFGDPQTGVDANALAACAALADGIDTLSKERIGAEMQKLLAAPNPAPAIGAMAQSGVLNRVLNGADITALAPFVELEHHLGIGPDWIARLACITTADVKDALRLSKSDNRKRLNIVDVMTNAISPGEAAYRYGYDTSLAAHLIVAASAASPLNPSASSRLGGSHLISH